MLGRCILLEKNILKNTEVWKVWKSLGLRTCEESPYLDILWMFWICQRSKVKKLSYSREIVNLYLSNSSFDNCWRGHKSEGTESSKWAWRTSFFFRRFPCFVHRKVSRANRFNFPFFLQQPRFFAPDAQGDVEKEKTTGCRSRWKLPISNEEIRKNRQRKRRKRRGEASGDVWTLSEFQGNGTEREEFYALVNRVQSRRTLNWKTERNEREGIWAHGPPRADMPTMIDNRQMRSQLGRCSYREHPCLPEL